jgi:phosphoglucomutase
MITSILSNLRRAPDGDFPTVKTPDPAEPAVYAEAVKLAGEKNADIILATDPDCDRLGVSAKNADGSFEVLGGNDVGALLTHYVLSRKNKVTGRDAVVKTIVTSDLGAVIAGRLGATVFNTLTGFKYIGEKIGGVDSDGSYDFAFGYEESCGYLAGTFVRDKDAVIGAVLIARWHRCIAKKVMTLHDALSS